MSAAVQWLLRAGATVDKKDAGGNLALHHAAQGGRQTHTITSVYKHNVCTFEW